MDDFKSASQLIKAIDQVKTVERLRPGNRQSIFILMRTYELTHQQNMEELRQLAIGLLAVPVGYNADKLKRLMLQKTTTATLAFKTIVPGFTAASVVGVTTSAAVLMEPPIGSTPGDAPRSRAVGAVARSRDAGGSATRHLRLRWGETKRLRLGDS